ncbi:MAG: energy-coupling factor ABC transporter permease [Propionibacteriaceae bacterium]|jgi:cobalt/nickel transport system permease protein|nr:energy-coupling factor ABC transporter permease [Propionibacteriaceae bacterium]
MHMADALLSPAVGLSMNAIAVVAIGTSVAKVKRDEFSEKKIPIMGVAGALVFAGQMINFTIPGTGSSGHIGGGILLAGLVGAVPAFLAISAVLIIQCLFFADGGLLALGCNIFNLGIIPCLVIFPLIFRPLLRRGTDYKRLSLASILSVVVALQLGAFGVVVETLLSGITELPFATFLGLMLPIHLVIGVIEGIVTAGVLCFVYSMRAEIIEAQSLGKPIGGSTRKVLIALAISTVIIAGGLSLVASTHPDGLEWAIGKTTEQSLGEETELEGSGVIHEGAAEAQEKTSILPDYGFGADPDNSLGTTVAGLVGAGITFLVAAATGIIISRVKKRRSVETDA